jgi:hypothetical protein
MKKMKTLVIAALVVGLGTTGYLGSRALFSDVETSADNTFAVGTLDMSVGGANGTAFDSINISNVGVDGTVTGTKTWVVTNSGSVPGNLTFQVNDIKNYENGCNEPEAIVDANCDPTVADDGTIGEFGAELAVTVSLNTGAGFNNVISSTMANASQSQYATQWNLNAGTVTVPAGGSVSIKMDWANDPLTYGNEIQSDSLEYGLQFDLLQVVPS